MADAEELTQGRSAVDQRTHNPPVVGSIPTPATELNVIDGDLDAGAEPEAPELDKPHGEDGHNPDTCPDCQSETVQEGHVLSDKAYATVCQLMYRECPPLFQWQKEIRYTLRRGSTRWLIETLWAKSLQYQALNEQKKADKPLIVPASR